MTEKVEDHSSDDNRRNYFRVEDTIQLGWHPVSREVAHDHETDPRQHISERFLVLGEIHGLDQEARYLLRSIAEKDASLADYLRLMNRKLELLTRLLAEQEVAESGLKPYDVNISEGGLEFVHDAAIEPGGYLALQLVLPPDMGTVLAFARVAHCIPASEHGHQCFRIGVEFVRISDNDRQQVARHGMHVQTMQRRQRGTG